MNSHVFSHGRTPVGDETGAGGGAERRIGIGIAIGEGEGTVVEDTRGFEPVVDERIGG